MKMKTRLDAITAHWANLAQYYGGANAKRYRTNLKRAATAAHNTADLFARFEGEGRKIVIDDIETLRKAALLLTKLADEFEVAQRKADRIKADAVAHAKAQHEAEIHKALIELFGTIPNDTDNCVQGEHPVLIMGKDLAYFDRAGVDEFAKSKGCDRGLLSCSSNIGNLHWHAERGHVKDVARIIAENRISSRYPGRAHADGNNQRYYHAGWDDFIAWRSIRMQVRAACQPAGDNA